jgi:hypothetical protein
MIVLHRATHRREQLDKLERAMSAVSLGGEG